MDASAHLRRRRRKRRGWRGRRGRGRRRREFHHHLEEVGCPPEDVKNQNVGGGTPASKLKVCVRESMCVCVCERVLRCVAAGAPQQLASQTRATTLHSRGVRGIQRRARAS